LFLLSLLAVATYSPWPEPVAPELREYLLPRAGLGILKKWHWRMGEPSLEVSEESHDASQEEECMVMEAIIRR
jgi:hypothetical protein